MVLTLKYHKFHFGHLLSWNEVDFVETGFGPGGSVALVEDVAECGPLHLRAVLPLLLRGGHLALRLEARRAGGERPRERPRVGKVLSQRAPDLWESELSHVLY